MKPRAMTGEPATGRKDGRWMFHDGWILLLALVCFGAAGIGLFVWSAPSGGGGWLRFAAMLAILVVVGGIVAPLVTRTLRRR